MKQILLILSLFSYFTALSQDNADTSLYFYNGNMIIKDGKKISIILKLLIFQDSSLQGSYYYKKSGDSLKLYGKLRSNNSFYLTETNLQDTIKGYITGTINQNKKVISGKWVSDLTDERRLVRLIRFFPKKHKY